MRATYLSGYLRGANITFSVKTILFRVVLACVGIVFVFLTGELVLRVLYAVDQARGGDLQERLERSRQTDVGKTGGEFNMTGLVQPSDFPDVVYELKPDLEGRFRNEPIRTSSQGIRDKEHAVAKPANTYRIVGLGDSVMFGWGVGQEEMYLAVLEDRLNALPGDHPTFETLNFAVPGYNTTMEVAVFEHRALAFDPDLVIIQFVNNDYGVPIFMQRPKDATDVHRSYFLDFLRTRMSWIQSARDDDLMTYRLHGLDTTEKEEVLQQYRHMVGPHGYINAMTHLSELTASRHIPVIIIWGTGTAQQKTIIDELAKKFGFHVVSAAPWTHAYCKRAGIEDTSKARRKALWVSQADHHPNARAHTIYVEALMDEMGRLGAIDYTSPWDVSEPKPTSP